ncbi:isoprenylcysteine carboxylmethyltransferase family protein [uncultured Draconibacterium sp.]|uniref:methyltransferase family protein n=1 Tax=uncultured Draconibacterium sp. TaxID=1573823 RepID=UPI003217667F
MDFCRIVTLAGYFVFAFLIVFKQSQLKKAGVQTSSRKQGIKRHIITLFLILFFVLFTSELILKTLKISYFLLPAKLNIYFHHSLFYTITGAVIEVLAVVVMYLTLKEFKHSLRFGLQANNLGKLVTSGIFSKSRNPFFVSVLLQFVGISLVFPTPFFAAITLLSIVSIHFFICKEEKFMRENYGDDYKKYTQKVRRYF